MQFDPSMIEDRIRPLVDALNDTGILNTCSSCEGHFEDELHERHKADVRFYPADGISIERLEEFINNLFLQFNSRESFAPVALHPYKLYIPNPDNVQPNSVFVIGLEPFRQHDSPAKKRTDVDNAINTLVDIVKSTSTKDKK